MIMFETEHLKREGVNLKNGSNVCSAPDLPPLSRNSIVDVSYIFPSTIQNYCQLQRVGRWLPLNMSNGAVCLFIYHIELIVSVKTYSILQAQVLGARL